MDKAMVISREYVTLIKHGVAQQKLSAENKKTLRAKAVKSTGWFWQAIQEFQTTLTKFGSEMTLSLEPPREKTKGGPTQVTCASTKFENGQLSQRFMSNTNRRR